jgi:hypothetical protein
VSKKLNKRDLLKKLILFPKNGVRAFFSKEMKLLNDLIDRYSEEFIAALSLDKKYDSVAILLCESFKKDLDKRFSNFNYKIDETKYDKITLSKDKVGEDVQTSKKIKTLRGFLNG